jgi:hypothetical protein
MNWSIHQFEVRGTNGARTCSFSALTINFFIFIFIFFYPFFFGEIGKNVEQGTRRVRQKTYDIIIFIFNGNFSIIWISWKVHILYTWISPLGPGSRSPFQTTINPGPDLPINPFWQLHKAYNRATWHPIFPLICKRGNHDMSADFLGSPQWKRYGTPDQDPFQLRGAGPLYIRVFL